MVTEVVVCYRMLFTCRILYCQRCVREMYFFSKNYEILIAKHCIWGGGESYVMRRTDLNAQVAMGRCRMGRREEL